MSPRNHARDSTTEPLPASIVTSSPAAVVALGAGRLKQCSWAKAPVRLDLMGVPDCAGAAAYGCADGQCGAGL